MYCSIQKLKAGKVRQPCKITTPQGNNLLALIASNRISAYERTFDKEVPFKGAILTQIANYYFEKLREAGFPVWTIDTKNKLPGNVTLGCFAEPVDCELIVRRYITGSLWRKLRDGKEVPWEDVHRLVESDTTFREYQRLNGLIFTPTLKDDENHDPPVSEQELIDRGIIKSTEEMAEIKKLCLDMFEFGEGLAEEQGLVLVDTKFEIGRDPVTGNLVVIDEIFTPDSSRYWYEYSVLESPGVEPIGLDKEFVRKDILALMVEQGFAPENPTDDEIKEGINHVIIPLGKFKEWSEAYLRFYKQITGQDFDHGYVLGNEHAPEKLSSYLNKYYPS